MPVTVLFVKTKGHLHFKRSNYYRNKIYYYIELQLMAITKLSVQVKSIA